MTPTQHLGHDQQQQAARQHRGRDGLDAAQVRRPRGVADIDREQPVVRGRMREPRQNEAPAERAFTDQRSYLGNAYATLLKATTFERLSCAVLAPSLNSLLTYSDADLARATATSPRVRIRSDWISNGFVERLGRGQLLDAGEERFGVVIHGLLDAAADLGGFADRTGNGGLDRGGDLLGTGVDRGSALLGGVGATLHEITSGFRHFRCSGSS